MTHTGTIC